MEIVKPKLSLDGQIEHLKEKGVLFNIMDEAEARDYLGQHNNYFKLTAYRKNYDKHPAGENKDKYINLEFAYLVDIAVIDMQLRYRIVHMALDLEHHTKLQLLRKMDEYNEDGYQVVQYYIDSLDEKQRKIFDSEINRNKGNIYCGDIESIKQDITQIRALNIGNLDWHLDNFFKVILSVSALDIL